LISFAIPELNYLARKYNFFKYVNALSAFNHDKVGLFFSPFIVTLKIIL